MTKTKKVKKKSCAKVPKKIKATFEEVGIDENIMQAIKDMPPITLDDIVKKIETLQRSKITCFICFVVIAFALIATILVLYNQNLLSVSYLLFPCLIISVFKAAEIFFSELTNN